MKKIIKLCAVFLVLILIGCQAEEVFTHGDNVKSISKSSITFADFKKITKERGDVVLKLPIQNGNIESRIASMSEFVIDTVAIRQHVNSNNKTTYSFRIYPTSELPMQNENYNLVYNKVGNDWEKSIYKFSTTQNATEVNVGNFEQIYNSASRMAILCYSTSVFAHCQGCPGACDYENCPAGVCFRYEVTTVQECSGAGGMPGNPSDGPSNNGDIGIIPANPYEFIPNIYNNPVFDNANYVNTIKATHFFNNLTYGQQVWANATQENTEAYLALIAYQIQNNWSASSAIICNNLLGILATAIPPTFDITDYPGKTDGLPFEWWTDDDFIKQNLKIFDDSNPNAPAEVPNIFEIMLFKQYPVAAWNHVQNALDATNATQALVASGTLTEPHNGRADAFRHAFWNALGTAENGSFITKAFTDAHEMGSDNHPLETQMDLFNNAQGISIGETFSITAPNSVIQAQILNAINFGTLQYLAPIDANGNVLPTTTIRWTNH